MLHFIAFLQNDLKHTYFSPKGQDLCDTIQISFCLPTCVNEDILSIEKKTIKTFLKSVRVLKSWDINSWYLSHYIRSENLS